ncbi:MAG: permease-like cell division protein FtsX [Acidobacteria bacterium]|nr:permease-like cell division protein FtsX [Acidobacteriota bacterium]
MNLWQALFYFLREATVSLVRSFKVSLLAVITIAVSLFVSGMLMLLSGNLSRLLGDWQARARVVVYLKGDATADQVAGLRAELERTPGVEEVEFIDVNAAGEKFRRSFPSLSDLLEDWQSEPLPASLEVALSPQALGLGAGQPWTEEVRGKEFVEMVDDDRDWLRQVSTAVAVVQGIGVALGVVLLAAAMFTIASVIRLTAYLYHEEIAVMRIVGATEFFIRGPFYVEGFLQGLLGGLLAATGLYGAHFALKARYSSSVWGGVLLDHPPGVTTQIFLVPLGATAGLLGAVFSLRREDLAAPTTESL